MNSVDGHPAISVIMPALNASAHLAEALDSLQSQTFANWELICVDNGSTDNSLPLLQQYANHDGRIKILHEKIQGAYAARNTAMARAKGRYIAFLDADDQLPDCNVFRDLYLAAHESALEIAGGSLQLLHPDNTKSAEFPERDKGMLFHENGPIQYQSYQFDYGYWRFIYGRELLMRGNVSFPPYLRFQDQPFMIRAMLAAGRFWALKRPTYQYRIDHKPLRWNTEKLVGLLNGLAENLAISREHNLTRLHNLTVERLTTEYEGAIRGGRYHGTPAVLQAEARCLSSIDPSVLSQREKQLLEKYHHQRLRSTLWGCLRQPHTMPRRFLTYWQGRQRILPS